MSNRKVLLLWFLVSLALAGLVSPYASRLPDGLARVAADLGFADKEATVLRPRTSAAQNSTPGCSPQDSALDRHRTFVAGAISTVVVFAAATLVARALAATNSKNVERE